MENKSKTVTDSGKHENLFNIMPIYDNPDGWGPLPNIQEQFLNFPYFNKREKVGRVSDWLSSQKSGHGSHDYEDSEYSFHIVDNRVIQKTRGGFRRSTRGKRYQQYQQQRNQNQRGGKKNYSDQSQQQRGGKRGQYQTKRHFNPYFRFQQHRVQFRLPSVQLRDEIPLVSSIEFDDLTKLSMTPLSGNNLLSCGKLHKYDSNFDLVSTKKPVQLRRYENRTFFTTTTSQDPVFLRFANSNVGNVYATDTILSLLMAIPKSVYSWDIVIRRTGDQLWFDKRPDSQIDYLTVNETGHEPPSDDPVSINHPTNLTTEATFINQNFSQQVLLSDNPIEYEEPNPFIDSIPQGMEAASVAYRYRKLDFPNFSLVSRSELNGYEEKESKTELIIRALNQYDAKLSSTVEWSDKLDSQRAVILATENRNNSFKIGRWLAQCLLAGVGKLRIGYISRMMAKDSFNHHILGTQRYKLHELFTNQLGFKLENMWGCLNHIINTCMALEEGTYLLMRDPNNPSLNIYSIPPNINPDELQAPMDEQKLV